MQVCDVRYAVHYVHLGKKPPRRNLTEYDGICSIAYDGKKERYKLEADYDNYLKRLVRFRLDSGLTVLDLNLDENGEPKEILALRYDSQSEPKKVSFVAECNTPNLEAFSVKSFIAANQYGISLLNPNKSFIVTDSGEHDLKLIPSSDINETRKEAAKLLRVSSVALPYFFENVNNLIGSKTALFSVN